MSPSTMVRIAVQQLAGEWEGVAAGRVPDRHIAIFREVLPVALSWTHPAAPETERADVLALRGILETSGIRRPDANGGNPAD